LDYTRRFTKRADWYASYRPGYPAKIIAILEKKIGFRRRQVVADVGSGTGLLTKIFLENGNKVFGVEPNKSMRAYSERDLSGFRNFISVRGTAEHTTLPTKSVDLVTVGQALHWFNRVRASREFRRISKPGGSLCAVYNVKRSDRLGRAYEKVIRRHEVGKAAVPNSSMKRLRYFFKDGKYSKFTVPNEQSLDFEGLLGRILSSSYMPRPDESRGPSELRRDALNVFESFGSDGRVRLRYRTNIFIGSIG